jgi:hypothetical protein
VCVCMHVGIHARTYVHMYIYMHACMYVCVCVWREGREKTERERGGGEDHDILNFDLSRI